MITIAGITYLKKEPFCCVQFITEDGSDKTVIKLHSSTHGDEMRTIAPSEKNQDIISDLKNMLQESQDVIHIEHESSFIDELKNSILKQANNTNINNQLPSQIAKPNITINKNNNNIPKQILNISQGLINQNHIMSINKKSMNDILKTESVKIESWIFVNHLDQFYAERNSTSSTTLKFSSGQSIQLNISLPMFLSILEQHELNKIKPQNQHKHQNPRI